MTDHDALLKAVCDHPADDLPRLVYADWLEENGRPERAAFIRADIAADRLDPFDPARLRWELIDKPRLSEAPWQAEAFPPLPPRCGWPRVRFRRGFPWRVSTQTPAQLAALAGGPFALAPLEHLIVFWGGLHRFETLTEPAWPGRLTGLSVFNGDLGRAEVARLLASPLAERLEELHVRRLAADGLRLLVGSPLFGRLTAATLGDDPTARWVGEPLIAHAGPVRLRRLDLALAPVTPMLGRLLAAPVVRGLEELSLRRVPLRLVGSQAVAAADVPNLVSLDLKETAPGEEGLEALAASPVIRRLRKLDLSSNAINRARCVRLAESGAFAELRVLNLSANPVGNDGTVTLATSPHSANLLVLDLSHSQVGDEGIEAILASPLADRLVRLDLSGSPASAEMKELAKARLGDRLTV